MATNSYNENYKYTYSKEVDLLDALVNNIETAANNLDSNTIESTMLNFKSQNYSLLRPSNQQYFDELASYVNILLNNIRKRKALTEQWEKKRQIIENSYKRLQEIKKDVTNAKTVSELEKAKKRYERWKNESSKIKFGWDYNKKIDSAKSYILEKIGPEDAINELKSLLENAKRSNGLENDNIIKSWVSKYPLNCFHEVYKKEVNDLTSEAFSLVKEPVSNDNQNTSNTIAEAVPSVLLMNPTQSRAVNNLRKIMNTNSKDFSSVLQWIYAYRNVSFDGPYKQAISTLIPVDYGINLNNKYSIPSFESDNLTSKQIDSLVKDTVISYFGILLCGNSLSSSKKRNISETYKNSKTATVISKICKNEETADEILKSDNVCASKVSTSESKADVDVEVEVSIQSEDIIDFNKETNIDNAEAKHNNKTEIEVQISSILPEIEFDEKKFDSYSENETDLSLPEDKDESLVVEDTPNYESPYSLTTEDIENIESIYAFAEPKVEQNSIDIEQPKVNENSVKYTFHDTIDIDNQN